MTRQRRKNRRCFGKRLTKCIDNRYGGGFRKRFEWGPYFLGVKLETRINTPLDSVLLHAGIPLEVFDEHSVLCTTYVPGAYLEVLTLGGGAGAAFQYDEAA